MKTRIMIKRLSLGLVTLFLMMLSSTGYSQACTGNMVEVTLKNIVTTSSSVEYDVYIKNTSASNTIRMGGMAGSVRYTAGLFTAGTGTLTLIDSPNGTVGSGGQFPNTNNFGTVILEEAKTQLRWSQTSIPAASDGLFVNMPIGTDMKFARFRLSSSQPFLLSSYQLYIPLTSAGAITVCNAVVKCNASTASSNLTVALGNMVHPGSPYSLPACPTAAAASNLVAESPCAGAANGSATITLTGAPSPTATISYSVDGGAAVTGVPMTASAFTVSGLSAGSHVVAVTYPGCSAVSTSSFTIGAGTPITTNGSVTTSICDGATYVWPANGVSYTTAQSGTTFVSGCNTATLNLSITPATTNGSVSTSICDGQTYVWPANGLSYTEAQSGLTFVSGCNTATLDLAITPATTIGSVTTSICDGQTYVWPANGASYTTAQSGITVVDGCNTATLNLSITPATTTGSVTTSICEGQTYVWPANGASYTTAQSGVTVVDGCNTATLNLTVNPVTTTGSESVTACGTSYTWSVSGQSYNASGVYPYTVGCNTATLTLTLNTAAQTYYADTDGDTFGAGAPIESCTGQPANTSVNNTDCAPNDPLAWRTGNFFVDGDNDGFNNGFPAAPVCYGALTPSGYVAVNNGTDCNDALASVNPNASEVLGNEIDDNCDGTTDEVTPLSSLVASSCGVTLSSLSNTLFAYPLSNFLTQTGPIQGYRFRVTNGAQVRTLDSSINSFQLTNLVGGATYATTYTVEVSVKHGGHYRAYGPACSVTTPSVPNTTSISSPTCGSTMTDINATIFATAVPSASGYRFRVRNGATVVGTVDTSVNRFSLTSIAGYAFGTTYTVDVLLAFGGNYRPDTEYGPACSITTPATPGTSRVIQPACGSSISSFWTTIFAQQVSGAQGYKFVVTDGAQTREYATPNPRFALRNLGTVLPSTAYTIRVDVLYASSYVQGTVLCTITTTAGASRQANTALDIYEVKAYPNPYADTFKLDLNTSGEGQVGVRVYDMLGREVESREASVDNITNLEIGSRYPSGVYNIIVTQGDNVKTLRVIKR